MLSYAIQCVPSQSLQLRQGKRCGWNSLLLRRTARAEVAGVVGFVAGAPPWAKLEVFACQGIGSWSIKLALNLYSNWWKVESHEFPSITFACSYRCVGRSSSQTSIFLPSTLRVRCVRPVENCRFCRLSLEIVNHLVAKPNVVGAHYPV